jgi:6-phosphogluconolactonase
VKPRRNGDPVDVLVGSYTEGTGGRGITAYDQDPVTGVLTPLGVVAELTNPSYLACHPTEPWLYAVSETPDGTVHAFALAGGTTLEPRGARPTGGAHPCHLAVDASGRWLAVANYGGGSVALFPIAADGSLGPRSDLVRHVGNGPVAERQAGPHPHMAEPAGDKVFVPDLGTDEVYAYAIASGTGRLVQVGVMALPAGTGPRHLAFGAAGSAVLVAELDSSLITLRLEGADLRPVHRRPATVRPPRRVNTPSAVRISADGRHVYVGNRGADCIGVFALDADGTARPVADVLTGGQWPRDLALVGDFLYVANQHSDAVTVFRIDPETAVPVPSGPPLAVAAPACLIAPPATSARGG